MIRSRVMLGCKFRVRGRVRGRFRDRVDGVIPLSTKGFIRAEFRLAGRLSFRWETWVAFEGGRVFRFRRETLLSSRLGPV